MGINKRNRSPFFNKIILYTIILPAFISPIIGSASITQMQAVKADLGLSIVETQWLITAYTIFASSFLLFGGQLGDVFGHVKTFIAGLALYITSCILFSIGTSLTLVMVATIIKGLAVSLCISGSMSLPAVILPRDELKKALKHWASLCLAGWGLGPILGGIFASFGNWRLLYWITLGAFSILFISILYFRKELKTVKEKKKIDYFGSFFLITGLITLILLLSEGPFWGWTSPMNISLYAASPILLLLFIYSQKKVSNPIVIFSACKSPLFILSIILTFITVGIYYTFLYFINYYFQNAIGKNYSYFLSGVILMPATILVAFISIFSTKIVDKFGYKLTLSTGFLLMFSGMLIWMWLPEGITYLNLWWRFLITGLGVGLIFPAMTPFCVMSVKPKDSGMASGIYNSILFLGPSIIISIAAVWYTHTEMNHIYNLIHSSSDLLAKIPESKISILINSVHNNISKFNEVISGLDLSSQETKKLLITLKQSANSGFGKVGLLCAIFSAIGFILSIIIAPGKSNNKQIINK